MSAPGWSFDDWLVIEHGAGLVGVLGLGERDPHELGVHRSETVEQELRLQRDHGVVAVRSASMVSDAWACCSQASK